MHLLILHIAWVFGGAERTTANLITHLDRRQIQRITLVAPQALLPHLPTTYDHFIDSDAYQLSGGFSTWENLYKDARAISGLLREQAADLALGMMHYSSAILVLGARVARTKTKIIASYRGPFYEYMRYYEHGWRRRLFLRAVVASTALLAHLVIVPSYGTALELRRRFFTPLRRVVSIPNGIDHAAVALLSKAPATALPHQSSAFTPTVCAISRLAPEKNLSLLITAIHEVRRACAVRLIILGAGAERDNLEAQIRILELGDAVYLLGHHDNVYPYLSAADVFVHTCQFEGFGYTLLEALACKTAVIATDCPYGPREILGANQYGLLVPTDNAAALATAIIALLTDRDRCRELAEQGLKRAHELSIERMADAYTNALIQLLPEPHS